MQWLACAVGSTTVYVRSSDVQMIVEYRVGTPPPLTSSYLAGLGLIEGELVLSVRVGFRQTTAARTTRGLLLVTPTSKLSWAFEVDSTMGLVADKRPREMLTSEPGWLARARGGDRFLDVGAMVKAIGQE